MGSLSTALINSAGALQAYGSALNVIQNNIANANTPGYVRQDEVLLSLPFNPSAGLTGGVRPGPLLSARSEFLDQAVRSQQENAGAAQQQASDLGQVEPLFSLTSSFGISNAFSNFFNSFSNLAVNPNDPTARQAVVDQAGQVADSFHELATGINNVATNVDQQTSDAVAAVNHLAEQIAHINSQYRASATSSNDAGLAAQLSSSLEQLSQVANYTVIKTPDGAANVYLGGQTPLVIGDHQFQIQADQSGAQTALRDSQGNDITANITRGSLGALLQEKNTTLPGYLASLNQLASTFADTVNNQLSQGVDSHGTTPTTNLFQYNSAGDAAFSIAVTGITPDQIAAASVNSPGGNGNALAVAQLANAPVLGGFTLTQFYGNIGSQVGRDVSAANQNLTQAQSAVAYASSQRQDQTGVSIDEEAAKLLQYQQAYQAMAKIVGVINTMTDSIFTMLPA